MPPCLAAGALPGCFAVPAVIFIGCHGVYCWRLRHRVLLAAHPPVLGRRPLWSWEGLSRAGLAHTSPAHCGPGLALAPALLCLLPLHIGAGTAVA